MLQGREGQRPCQLSLVLAIWRAVEMPPGAAAAILGGLATGLFAVLTTLISLRR